MVSRVLTDLSLQELRDLAIRADIRIPPTVESERDFLIDQLEEWFDELDIENRPPKAHMHVLRAKFDFFREQPTYMTSLQDELGDIHMMSYQKSTIHMLMRDPAWGYVYWDFSDKDQEKIDGCSELVLRLLELKEPQISKQYVLNHFDISVHVDGRSQYINLPKSKYWYATALIVIFPDGREELIGFSNVIKSISRFLIDRVDQLLTTPRQLDVTLGGFINSSEFLGDNLLVEELLEEIKNRGGKWHE